MEVVHKGEPPAAAAAPSKSDVIKQHITNSREAKNNMKTRQRGGKRGGRGRHRTEGVRMTGVSCSLVLTHDTKDKVAKK